MNKMLLSLVIQIETDHDQNHRLIENQCLKVLQIYRLNYTKFSSVKKK